MSAHKRIYMDWAATAPLCGESAAAMADYMQGGMANIAVGANANSLHSEGRAAFAAMEGARRDIARCIGARGDELVFTCGATESDNMALVGMVEAICAERERGAKKSEGGPVHIITTSIEHDAVLNTAHRLESKGVELTCLSPDKNGFIQPEQLEQAIRPNTVLVSIMLANNEIGAIQPVAQCADIAHKAGALIHTDAVQALGKIPIDCKALGVDAASFSGHKICGPKGIGALYLKKGTPISPFILGGGQESGLRSGTQNVAGMVGFAAACKAICANESTLNAERARQTGLRDRLYQGLTAYDGVFQTVACKPGSADYLPNIANICVRGLESETLILRFDMLGFALSGGSACASHSLEPSRVLKQIGIERDLALGSLRFSIGRYTESDDVEACLAAFDKVLCWNDTK